ncbi:MAG: PqqD family protein [Bacteroidales bacterium]|nr:PqqD family protein [Bacteroidales bacterium]
MRIDETKKMRRVADEFLHIGTDDGDEDMTRVVALNPTAIELYEALLGRDFDVDDAASLLTERFEVDADTARRDAAEWLEQMQKEGLVHG